MALLAKPPGPRAARVRGSMSWPRKEEIEPQNAKQSIKDEMIRRRHDGCSCLDIATATRATSTLAARCPPTRDEQGTAVCARRMLADIATAQATVADHSGCGAADRERSCGAQFAHLC